MCRQNWLCHNNRQLVASKLANSCTFYSTLELSSSWGAQEEINDCDIEERFEIFPQESKNGFETF